MLSARTKRRLSENLFTVPSSSQFFCTHCSTSPIKCQTFSIVHLSKSCIISSIRFDIFNKYTIFFTFSLDKSRLLWLNIHNLWTFILMDDNDGNLVRIEGFDYSMLETSRYCSITQSPSTVGFFESKASNMTRSLRYWPYSCLMLNGDPL